MHSPNTGSGAAIAEFRTSLRSKDWRTKSFSSLVTTAAALIQESGHHGLFADCGWYEKPGSFGDSQPSVLMVCHGNFDFVIKLVFGTCDFKSDGSCVMPYSNTVAWLQV